MQLSTADRSGFRKKLLIEVTKQDILLGSNNHVAILCTLSLSKSKAFFVGTLKEGTMVVEERDSSRGFFGDVAAL